MTRTGTSGACWRARVPGVCSMSPTASLSVTRALASCDPAVAATAGGGLRLGDSHHLAARAVDRVVAPVRTQRSTFGSRRCLRTLRRHDTPGRICLFASEVSCRAGSLPTVERRVMRAGARRRLANACRCECTALTGPETALGCGTQAQQPNTRLRGRLARWERPKRAIDRCPICTLHDARVGMS